MAGAAESWTKPPASALISPPPPHHQHIHTHTHFGQIPQHTPFPKGGSVGEAVRGLVSVIEKYSLCAFDVERFDLITISDNRYTK